MRKVFSPSKKKKGKVVEFTNSIDPDEANCNKPPHLGLYGLYSSL